MWHEARKQEKKIRGMMVDYKKRAERRREYYERIKLDPAQFLQVHGRPCKINLDPAVALAADSRATMMPWQGHPDNMIDRFDVRAHLDIIPEYKPPQEPSRQSEEAQIEERQASYERYRTLVQNDFLGVSEDKFIHQIYIEERFGPIVKSTAEEEKKRLSDKKAAIGYVYEDSTPLPPVLDHEEEEEEDEDKKDDLSDIDLDVTIDVNELTSEQRDEMNDQSVKYGMTDDDFISFLQKDKEESEQLRLARELEEEKAMYSGRKSRRERRALREKKLQGRKVTSPPSYAVRESPTYKPFSRSPSRSRSRSKSPVNAGQITYITSFGGEASEDDDRKGKGKQQSSTAPLQQHSTSKPLGAKISEKTARLNSGTDSSQAVLIGPQLPSQVKLRSRRSTSESSSSTSSRRSTSRSSSSYNSRRRRQHHKRPSSSRYRHRSSSASLSSSRSRGSTDFRKRYSSSHSPHRTHSRTQSHSRHRSRSRSKSLPLAEKRHHSRSSSRSLSRPKSRSRSLSNASRHSKSRSRSPSASHSSSRSNSVSPLAAGVETSKLPSSPKLPSPPVKSYYQRSLARSNSEPASSSEAGDEDDDNDNEEKSSSPKSSALSLGRPQTVVGKAGPTSKSTLTPQEKLKRKMQLLLNKQYKADKRAQQEKMEKQQQERQDRAEELREMAIKMRQRERERRHRIQEYEREQDIDHPSRSSDHGSRRDGDRGSPYSRRESESPSDGERKERSRSSDRRRRENDRSSGRKESSSSGRSEDRRSRDESSRRPGHDRRDDSSRRSRDRPESSRREVERYSSSRRDDRASDMSRREYGRSSRHVGPCGSSPSQRESRSPIHSRKDSSHRDTERSSEHPRRGGGDEHISRSDLSRKAPSHSSAYRRYSDRRSSPGRRSRSRSRSQSPARRHRNR